MNNNHLIGIFSLVNIALGTLYGLSDGPYVEIESERIIPASELLSSGSDDGFVITLALLTFVITTLAAAISIVKQTRSNTLALTYIVNYFVYGFFIYLVQLDSPLISSIKFGDWPLLLGLTVPTALLIVVVVMFTKRMQFGAE